MIIFSLPKDLLQEAWSHVSNTCDEMMALQEQVIPAVLYFVIFCPVLVVYFIVFSKQPKKSYF